MPAASRITDHQIGAGDFALHSVQGNEWRSVSNRCDDYFITNDFFSIKRMHRLAQLVAHIIGNVHNVVDRADANRLQTVFEPLRRFADL
jgi:hypothetical protein